MRHLFIVGLFATTSSFAQGSYFYISLDVTKPLSSTTWISSATGRGAKIGYRTFINPRFSAGIDLGSVTLDQYQPTTTIQQENGAVTTDYFKYIYSYSATASGQYNFLVGDGETFIPYAGLGVGANHNEYLIYYNVYKDSDGHWGFLLRPEAGLLVKFGKRSSIGAMAAIHYDYSTNGSERFDYNNYSALGFQFGVVLTDW